MDKKRILISVRAEFDGDSPVRTLLREAGFQRAKNLRGGILEWIDKVDPTQPKY